MKKWPIIRHIRALVLAYRVERFAQVCGQVGLGTGRPNPSDLEYLRVVWEGKA